jgi:hypothetical protein
METATVPGRRIHFYQQFTLTPFQKGFPDCRKVLPVHKERLYTGLFQSLLQI